MNLRYVILDLVQFVGCLGVCATALNMGQFAVWAAAAVVWAALTAWLGTGVAPVHVAV